jgi:hypothetical protein
MPRPPTAVAAPRGQRCPDLEAHAADLRVCLGAEARVLAHDGADHAGLADAMGRALEGRDVEGLIFPIGSVDGTDDGRLGGPRAEEILRINLLSVVSVVSRFLPGMMGRGRGVIVGFGSVAAARGRGRNVLYSASKRGLESFGEACGTLAEPAASSWRSTASATSTRTRLSVAGCSSPRRIPRPSRRAYAGSWGVGAARATFRRSGGPSRGRSAVSRGRSSDA